MTALQLAKRLALTWLSVSWFAYFVFDVLKDGHGSRLGRAIVAGFFVALTTAPAYYWRLKSKDRSGSGSRAMSRANSKVSPKQGAGLAGMDIVTFVPTIYPRRARHFFEATLGLCCV